MGLRRERAAIGRALDERDIEPEPDEPPDRLQDLPRRLPAAGPARRIEHLLMYAGLLGDVGGCRGQLFALERGGGVARWFA